MTFVSKFQLVLKKLLTSFEFLALGHEYMTTSLQIQNITVSVLNIWNKKDYMLIISFTSFTDCSFFTGMG